MDETSDELAQAFVQFSLDCGVLRFGEFKTKAGRISPYFFNAGLFDDGAKLGQLAEFYARRLLASGLQFDMLFGPAYKGITLASALAVELAPQNITVTCVCPGPTPTNFSKTAKREDGSDTNREGQGLLRIPPQRVVAEALAALQQGRACVFPGTGVAIASQFFRLMPRRLMRLLLRWRHDKE